MELDCKLKQHNLEWKKHGLFHPISIGPDIAVPNGIFVAYLRAKSWLKRSHSRCAPSGSEMAMATILPEAMAPTIIISIVPSSKERCRRPYAGAGF